MEAKPITLNTLLLAAAAVIAIEWAAGAIIAVNFLPASIGLGFARIFQIVVMIIMIRKLELGLTSVGIKRSTVCSGLKKGLIWSFCFGFVSALVLGLLLLLSIDVTKLFPPFAYFTPINLFFYFFAGTILGPLAEEFFFRGLLFGYFRKFGFAAALIISTLLFILAHISGSVLPITQIVGGLLFASAYEVEKNLIVPIVIHCLGNLAIFSLSIII